MKLLAKLLSLFIAFTFILLVLSLIFDSAPDLLPFLLVILGVNIIPLLTISFAGIGLTRNSENTILKFVMLYMLLSFIFSIYYTFGNFNHFTSDVYQGYVKFYMLYTSFHIGAFVLCLISIVEVNNGISSFFRRVSLFTIALNIISKVVDLVNNWVQSLPRLAPTISVETIFGADQFSSKFALASASILIVSVLLLFLTNYAFSSKDYIVDESTLDYGNLKTETNRVIKERMDHLYRPKENNVVVPPINTDTMNINNQLNANANVGAVKEQAKKVNVTNTSLNSIFNMSSGPVVNESINEKENKND